MRLLFLAACVLAAIGLTGCLSTYHEDYHRSSSMELGPRGVEATGEGEHNVRHWISPWPAQPDCARP